MTARNAAHTSFAHLDHPYLAIRYNDIGFNVVKRDVGLSLPTRRERMLDDKRPPQKSLERVSGLVRAQSTRLSVVDDGFTARTAAVAARCFIPRPMSATPASWRLGGCRRRFGAARSDRFGLTRLTLPDSRGLSTLRSFNGACVVLISSPRVSWYPADYDPWAMYQALAECAGGFGRGVRKIRRTLK